ncbi:MAG: chaperone modulator CbpM [Acetobacteraceae bacterium]
MLEYQEFCFRARLESGTLDAWIAAGWLIPAATEPKRAFSEADLARAQLIQDLSRDLGINDEGVAVILDLIDQIHGLRRSLKSLSSALAVLPADARATIHRKLEAGII